MTIPLVLASDNGYMFPLFVALQSAIDSASPDTILDFHLLLAGGVSRENLEKLKQLKAQYNCHNITIHNMQDAYKNIGMRIEHITYPTYYRLKIPSLLEAIDKCIYLDCDVVVRQDLSELYNFDIRDSYIAGVRAAGYCRTNRSVQNTLSRLNIPSIDQYINAGVILFNLDRLRKDNIEKVFNSLIQNNYSSQDQDIINKVCYGKIVTLPSCYNVMLYGLLADPASEVYQSDTGLQKAYTFDDWRQGRENPVIIHYANKRKPWNDLSVDCADIWWGIARKLPFFDEIFDFYVDDLSQSAADQRKQLVEAMRHLEKSVAYQFKRAASVIRGQGIAALLRKVKSRLDDFVHK